MSGFVERERKAGFQYVEDLFATVKQVYISACKWDDILPDTQFAIFSKDNPFVPFYEKAINMLHDALVEYTQHGYTGLTIKNGRAELYKRPSNRKKKNAPMA